MLDGLEPQPDVQNRVALLAKSLSDLIRTEQRCSVWIGAGLSMGCGYPDWSTAVQQLCEECLPEKLDLPPEHDPTALLVNAQRCKDYALERYTAVLADMFGHQPRLLRAAYSHICACPITYVVTTNYDPCLETANAGRRRVIAYPNLCFLPDQHGLAVYLHGKARWGIRVDASKLLLTDNELRTAYVHSFIPSFLTQLLGYTATVFVGCRLSEPVLVNLFEKLRDIHSQTGIKTAKKFILLSDGPDPEADTKEAEGMLNLGITVLRYPIYNGPASPFGYDTHRWLDEIWFHVRATLEESSGSLNEPGGLKV